MAKDILYPLRRLHGELHEMKIKYNSRRNLRKEYRNFFSKNPKAVFLVLTPEHGNLGDHAIAQAEIELLAQLGVKYIEIPGWKLKEMMRENQLHLLNTYPILINGGGNLGTLWMDVETLERSIFQKNPKSPIFVLPNTIFYEENDWGQNKLQESIKIYNRHRKLKLYAREKTSYNFMKPIYRDVRLVPDMVLSMAPYTTATQRNGCILCLRSDLERTLTEEQSATIRQQAKCIFGENLYDTDMVEGNHIALSEREATLKKKFDEFASAELVITDRLHGMIFCAITGTPCIVVNSKSPKVRGCYEWIKHLEYIRFADNPEDIVTEYYKIPRGPHSYDNSNLTHYFESLAEDIQTIWR